MRRLNLRPIHSDIASWHRRLSPLTDQLIISGDLNEDPTLAKVQLTEWQQAGITHILDTREEWTDEAFVAEHTPDITYGWFGTHDNGTPQPDQWFTDGLAFALEALATPNAVLLVHCHMGINRGPSMAYRILLELGWNPDDAFDAIRAARPIANMRYQKDATNHHNRSNDRQRSAHSRHEEPRANSSVGSPGCPQTDDACTRHRARAADE